MQQAYGHSIEVAASLNALLPIGLAFGGVCFGLFSDHIKKIAYPGRICAISSLVFLAALIYLSSIPVWVVVILLFLSGFCLGGATLAFPAVVQHCSASMRGTAIGIVTTCGYIGAGVLNIVVPLLIGKVPSFQKSPFTFVKPMHLTDVQEEIVSAFNFGMLPLIAALILAIFAAFMMRDAPQEAREAASAT